MDNPAVPIPSTPLQPAVSLPAESPNRRWILWSASGLTVLTLGVALGIFVSKFLNQSQNLSQLTPTPSPTPQTQSPTPTPTSTSDPTADWKIYTNTNNSTKFSIQYPNNWQYNEQTADAKTYAVNFTGNEGNVSIVWGNGFGGAYCTDPDNLGLKIETYSLTKEELTGCISTNPNGIKSWFLFKEISSGLSIKIQAKTSPASIDDQLLDQILSTFKFLDQDNVSNLCTTDADCGVNICDCKADLNQNIPVAKKACARYCPGAPRCINNRCQLITGNN